MSRDINPFGLRMPEDLRTSLEKSARLNHRSLNAELVVRLRKSVEETPILYPEINEGSEEYTAVDDKKLLTEFIEKMPKKKRSALLKFIKTM